MPAEVSSALAFGAALVLVFVVGKLLSVPIRVLGRLLLNGVMGGMALFLLNIIGGLIGFTVAINPLTALIAGTLGIPGVLLIIALRIILFL